MRQLAAAFEESAIRQSGIKLPHSKG